MPIVLTLMKTNTGMLIPASAEDAEKVNKIKPGKRFTAEWKIRKDSELDKERAKFFILLDLAFDRWEPPELEDRHKKYGIPQKNPKAFRSDVLILCGHREAYFNLRGEVRYQAKSIANGAITAQEMADIHVKACNLVRENILQNYTEEDLNQVLAEIEKLQGLRND